MSVFIRRFLSDPGDDVLLEIESVNILDLDPPASITGIGTGTVLIAAEFENGPYNAVTEVTSADDLQTSFGSFGYTYGGVIGNYPSAVQRHADAAIDGEFWNGNGFIQLSGKKFSRLLIVRADTSIGAVQFTRRCSVTGVGQFRYAMVPGQHLDIDINDPAGSFVTTFTATAAVRTASGGTFPTTFVGGESITLGYDHAANFTVFFQAADQSIGQVIARINAFAGFTFVDNNGGQLRFTSRQRGSGAQVRVVAASAGGVLTALGLTVLVTAGTGNVDDILAVTPLELQAVVNAEMGVSAFLEFDQAGNPRIVATAAGEANAPPFMRVLSTTTATPLGFTNGQLVTNTGRAILIGATGVTDPTLFAGGETLTLFDSSVGTNTLVTFAAGDQTPADVVAKINTFFATTVAYAGQGTGGTIILASMRPGGTIRVVATDSGGTATILGLVVGSSATGTLPPAGTIPAGTIVQNVPAGIGTPPVLYVTTQDVVTTATNVGPYTARVRHAVDDGTGISTAAGQLTRIGAPIQFAGFTVTNSTPTTSALTEGQIDAAYTTALAATLNVNSVARVTNIIYSARQSNVLRSQLRQNALDASAKGMFGRMACVRPPLNTARATALSNTAQPGVGATRDQRVIYNYPGFNTFVPLVAQRGTGGGTGFTADGNLDVGSDGFMASILSQLPPEENPGQATTFLAAVNGIETGANVQNFDIVDYELFKGAGIAAARLDDGTGIFQSGVTSVDPGVFPQLTRISRRRMADFIQDSVARRAKAFGKKLSTNARRRAIMAEIRSFMEGLLGVTNPGSQRIAGFTLTDKKSNTASTLGRGLYKIVLRVRTLASLDSIVIATTVGEQVEVEEVLPQAA